MRPQERTLSWRDWNAHCVALASSGGDDDGQRLGARDARRNRDIDLIKPYEAGSQSSKAGLAVLPPNLYNRTRCLKERAKGDAKAALRCWQHSAQSCAVNDNGFPRTGGIEFRHRAEVRVVLENSHSFAVLRSGEKTRPGSVHRSLERAALHAVKHDANRSLPDREFKRRLRIDLEGRNKPQGRFDAADFHRGSAELFWQAVRFP